MYLADFPIIHKRISKKIGTYTGIGPSRRMEVKDKQVFVDFLNSVVPIGMALKEAKIDPTNLSDNVILSLSPLVVNSEYVKPNRFYYTVLEKNNFKFPMGCFTVLSEIINLACATAELPENRVKYLFLRKIADKLHLQFPNCNKSIRVLMVDEQRHVYLFHERFMFLTRGDTGAAKNPKGHIDLFGLDLHGVIEAYLTGDELYNTMYKMPTVLTFKNVPSTDKSSGGAFLAARLNKPTEHTWVEINGRDKQLNEEITLEFNSVSQNYVTNPKTVLTDERWAAIKSMLDFTGKYNDVKINSRGKLIATRTSLSKAS